MKRSLFTALFATLLVMAFSITAFADLTVEQIVEKSLDREKGKNKTSQVAMEIVKGSSRRVKTFKQFVLHTPAGSRKLIRFEKPASILGTAFLSWENKTKDDDQWLYLPSRKAVRRVAGSDKSSSFMGSDLTYEDMGEQQASDRTHKLVDDTTFEGRAVWVVESTAKPEMKTGYHVAKSWIDKETFIAIKMEVFDKSGKLIKTMVIKKWEKVDGVWTVNKLIVTPTDGKTVTTLNISNAKFDIELSESKFTKEALKAF